MDKSLDRFYLYDGTKAVSLRRYPESAWVHYTPFLNEEEGDVEKYYGVVPWLSRGIDIRANALATLPFVIYNEDGSEFDTSDEYGNELGFLPEPEKLLFLIEAALTLLGRAYIHIEGSASSPYNLRYLHPATITPNIDPADGLTGFTRQIGPSETIYDLDEILYFWSLDPFVEIGPGNNPPGKAALAAAGVLHNVDEFAETFFKRGAIKAMLLSVSGNTVQEERDRVKTWWQKLFSGISNAWQTEVVNADAVKPVPVGEGVKELENTELTAEKREDIATALGVPQTLMFSNAANYATAQEDRLSFYQETVIPGSRVIERILNRQLFDHVGKRWKFHPETLDVFQVDENERAQAFSYYVNSGLKQSVVAEMLGLELPTGVDYADLDPDESQLLARLPVAQRTSGAGEGPATQQPLPSPIMSNYGTNGRQRAATLEAIESDLKKWQRKALSKGATCSFESTFIPAEVTAYIRTALADATSPEEVKAAFSAPFRYRNHGMEWSEYP